MSESAIMNRARQFVAMFLAACVVSSCEASSDSQYVQQRIPIGIQSGKTATVEIASLSGNGWNEVGIRCSSAVWAALSAGAVSVRLVASDKSGTKVINIAPGSHKLWPVDSFYYLFAVGGERDASAVVEITFASAPTGTTNAEILVLKTPADTGP